MKRFRCFFPQGRLRLPASIISGVIFGLGFFVLYVSNASSYLSDDPKTCVNCHVMNSNYASWSHGSHRETATCNDCHVPHNNVFNKYYFKAKDGLRHATIFTLHAEPQVIRIKEAGKGVVMKNCLRCHSDLITDSKLLRTTAVFDDFRHDRKCWECHRETPHGRVNSLSTTPNAKIPSPGSPVPDWLHELLNK